jgi:hypothetical protein
MPIKFISAYNGYWLTVVPQPTGTFVVDIVAVGGTDRAVGTQAYATVDGALASARLIIDRGILDGDASFTTSNSPLQG